MTAVTFDWPRFLVSFIAAPLVVTLLTFWALIPIYALIVGGPLYLIAGLPLAAWYLQQKDAQGLGLILLALISGVVLQTVIIISIAWYYRDLGILDALPAFLTMGVLFSVLWTGTFLLIYRLLAHAAQPSVPKEPPHVQP